MKYLSVFENWDDFDEAFLGGELDGPHVSYIKDEDWVEYISSMPIILEEDSYYVEECEFIKERVLQIHDDYFTIDIETGCIVGSRFGAYNGERIDDQELMDYLRKIRIKSYDGDSFTINQPEELVCYPGQRMYFVVNGGAAEGWLIGDFVTPGSEYYGYFWVIPA